MILRMIHSVLGSYVASAENVASSILGKWELFPFNNIIYTFSLIYRFLNRLHLSTDLQKGPSGIWAV